MVPLVSVNATIRSLRHRVLSALILGTMTAHGARGGALDGAPIRWAGSLWHDGLVEVSFPAGESDDLGALLVPGAIASEPGVDVLGARVVPSLAVARTLVVQVAGLPLYERDGRPWFIGMPHYDSGAGAKPGPMLGLYRVVSSLGWSLIGQNLPGRTNAVVVASADNPLAMRAFEVVSDGRDSTGTHDDMVFVHEYVRGDFDRVVRVTSVSTTASFGGGGLMVRESLDAGRSASDPNFSRFAAVEVPGSYFLKPRPALIARTSRPGNVAFVASGSEVEFPNVWFRLVRTGETILAYQRTRPPQSPDDAWEPVGSGTFAGLADGVFVGAHYSPQLAYSLPENPNPLPVAAAQFESYGEFSRLFLAIDGGDALSIHRLGDTRFLFWGGFGFGRSHVQESTDFTTWTDDPDRRSAPYYIRDGDGARFWRLAD